MEAEEECWHTSLADRLPDIVFNISSGFTTGTDNDFLKNGTNFIKPFPLDRVFVQGFKQ